MLLKWSQEAPPLQISLKIGEMKYRSSMERCPVGGLTMMTSFLAAFTMTSSFGPKSLTSTGWLIIALVSSSCRLASISRWCLAWRTSTASSLILSPGRFPREHQENQMFVAQNPLTLRHRCIFRTSYGVRIFFSLPIFLLHTVDESAPDGSTSRAMLALQKLFGDLAFLKNFH